MTDASRTRSEGKPGEPQVQLFESMVLPLVDRVLETVTDLRKTLPERLAEIEASAAARAKVVDDHEVRIRELERAAGKGREENALVRKIVFGALSALLLVTITTLLNYGIATLLGLLRP